MVKTIVITGNRDWLQPRQVIKCCTKQFISLQNSKIHFCCKEYPSRDCRVILHSLWQGIIHALLLSQPQMQGVAPVITTAGIMQPPCTPWYDSIVCVSTYKWHRRQWSHIQHSKGWVSPTPMDRFTSSSITSPLVEKAQGTSSKLRSEPLGDVEMSFDKVMEEVRETNPMTLLKKVSYNRKHIVNRCKYIELYCRICFSFHFQSLELYTLCVFSAPT